MRFLKTVLPTDPASILILLFLLMAFLLSSHSAWAVQQGSLPGDDGRGAHSEIASEFAFRHGRLRWDITPTNLDPNVLSELIFDDLDICQAGLSIKNQYKNFCSRLNLGFGKIMDGQGTDSDYVENDRKGLYAKSTFDIHADDIRDMSLGAGYQFRLYKKKMKINLLAGMALNMQNLRMQNGLQLFAENSEIPDVGPIDGLNSTYRTQWTSWWLGTDVYLQPSEKITIITSFEYHQAAYKASADWNLRGQFRHPVSFTHKAQGHGFVFKIGPQYSLFERFCLGVACRLQQWSTKSGTDTVFFRGGTESQMRLNQVEWTSQAFFFSAEYSF